MNAGNFEGTGMGGSIYRSDNSLLRSFSSMPASSLNITGKEVFLVEKFPFTAVLAYVPVAS